MSLGREQSLRLAVVITSGTGTGTFTTAWDLIRRIRVCPPTETHTYDFFLKDADGLLIFDSTKAGTMTGTFSAPLGISLGILKTILIQNASVDGTYQIRLDMH